MISLAPSTRRAVVPLFAPSRARWFARLSAAYLLATLLHGSWSNLRAQGAGAREVFGIVVDEGDHPLAEVSVSIRAERAPTHRDATTGADGTFRIACTRASGGLLVSLRRIGFYQRVVVTACDDAVTQPLKIRLLAIPQALQSLVTRAPRSVSSVQRDRTAHDAKYGSAVVLQLPFTPGELRDVGMAQPGVRIGSGDGLAVSINGQRPSQTGLTVDGGRYAGATLPQESVREVLVSTSSFDPARGGFSGGLVEASTREGGAQWSLAGSISGSGAALQLPSDPPSAFDRGARRGQLSLGGGGPVAGDRLRVFAAIDASDRRSDVTSLDGASAEQLAPFGLPVAVAKRASDALRSIGALGVSSIATPRRSTSEHGLLRLDGKALDDAHWTLRVNRQESEASAAGLTPVSVASTALHRTGRLTGALAQWEMPVGTGASFLVRTTTSARRDETAPAMARPAGQAWVATDDSTGLGWISFGGATSARATRTRMSQAIAELTLPSAAHEWRIGASLDDERSEVNAQFDPGRFQYASLADLTANRPSIFTQRSAVPEGAFRVSNGSLYARDQWTPNPLFALVYGLRAEFGWTHNENPFDLPGFSPPASQGEWSLSPRMGFITENVAHTVTISGGIGDFRGTIAAASYTDALREGLSAGLGAHSCSAPMVMAPQWSLLLPAGDPIPAGCASSPTAVSDSVQSRSSTVLSRGFAAPHVTRGALRVVWSLGGSHSIELDGDVDFGWRQPVASALNLRRTPSKLASEGGRAMFVPLGSIDPATGFIPAGAGLDVPSLGTIRELRSDGKSRGALSSAAWTMSVPVRGHQLINTLSYTYHRAVSRTTAVDAPDGETGITGLDPNRAEWTTSDQEQRHAIQFLTMLLWRNSFTISAVGVIASGLPYTPIVGGDVNGDGRVNDAAFIPDPRLERDTLLLRGIQQLLNNADPSTRACLLASTGALARRNSCTSPMSTNVNVQANWRPRRLGGGTVSARLSNAAAGLDYLLHGSERLHGWGQPMFPNPVLLEPRGFDASAGKWHYQVNQLFGTGARVPSIQLPLSLQLRMRVPIGAVAAPLPGISAGGRTVAAMQQLLAQRVLNLPRFVLEHADSLGLQLSVQQIVRLQPTADSLQQRMDVAALQLARAIVDTSQSTDSRQMREAMAAEIRALVVRSVEEVKALFTTEQWAKIPAAMQSPALRIPTAIEAEGHFTSGNP